jgi:hypothetical protein
MMKKNYYQKIAVLGLLLLIIFGFQKYTDKEKENFPEVQFISESLPTNILTEFDPNDLDENQWQKLGFSEKQTTTILKYKKIVGGKFLSKEQFKKCYAVLMKNLLNCRILFYSRKAIKTQNQVIIISNNLKKLL